MIKAKQHQRAFQAVTRSGKRSGTVTQHQGKHTGYALSLAIPALGRLNSALTLYPWHEFERENWLGRRGKKRAKGKMNATSELNEVIKI